MNTNDLPTPEELVAARRTISRLSRAIPIDDVLTQDRKPAWGLLIDGKLGIAITCSWLGDNVDPAYREAWNQMMASDND